MKFENVKPGDKVLRKISGGIIDMQMYLGNVTKVSATRFTVQFPYHDVRKAGDPNYSEQVYDKKGDRYPRDRSPWSRTREEIVPYDVEAAREYTDWKARSMAIRKFNKCIQEIADAKNLHLLNIDTLNTVVEELENVADLLAPVKNVSEG